MRRKRGYIYLGCKITYNVGNKSDAKVYRDLMRLIEVFKPVALHLQEVWDRKHVVREVAIMTGYHPVIPGGPAAHNSALIHPDAKVKNSGTLLLSERRWVGRRVAGAKRHGMARKNEATYVRYQAWGRNWLDANVHLVPSHQVKRACRLAKLQVRVLVAWMRTRRRITSVCGDFNETLTHRCNSLGPLEKIAKMYTGKTRGSRGIDYWGVLKRQLRSRPFAYEVEVPEAGYSSDHNPVVLHIFRKVKS